jgi:hypothetical protein
MNRSSHGSGLQRTGSQAANVEPSLIDPAVYPCRRPIEASDLENLRELGREVRALRFVRGRLVVRSSQFGLLAQVPRMTLWRIEAGVRRTRQSTLQRIAKAASLLNPSAGTQDEILERLIKAAGTSLAPPSPYQYRINRRRMRRFRKTNANYYLRELSGRDSSAVKG